ncbi:MAG TPA: hypothetical protein PLV92_27465, partial [Pirellulaceae bacterium]|nr:hypothetical protein [Pirellulaceae bacterium]
MAAVEDKLRLDLERLRRGKSRIAASSAAERLQWVRACADGVADVSREWAEAACAAKGIAIGSPQRAEEILAGPVATLRFLRLLEHTLDGIAKTGTPRLPGPPSSGSDGRLRVPIMPTGCLYDSIVFFPYRVTAWMNAGI